MEFKKDKNTYIIRLYKGEEVVSSLKEFAKNENILGAKIEGIGAGTNIITSWFDPSKNEYVQKEFNDYYEITSLIGNISSLNNEPYFHLHINFSDKNCNTYGGHLIKCYISVTAEIFITVLDKIERKFDEDIKINVFNLK